MRELKIFSKQKRVGEVNRWIKHPPKKIWKNSLNKETYSMKNLWMYGAISSAIKKDNED